MAKKTTLFVLSFLMMFGIVSAQTIIFQNDLETWTDPNSPAGFRGSKTNILASKIVQYTASANSGANAVQLINDTTVHKRFTTQHVPVENGTTYTIKFWVRGRGEIRTGLFDNRTTPNSNGYSSYNAYIQVNSTTWAQHTQTITAANTTTQAEFIFSVNNTVAANGHIQLDDVEISYGGSNPGVTEARIYDIQFSTATPADSPFKDQVVKTHGIVTAKHTDGYFIQDGQGAWNGIYVFDKNNPVTEGDSITITATVKEHFDMTQLATITAFVKNSSGNTLPAPEVITTANVKTEPYEGVLVKVEQAKCTNANAGFGMWEINDGSGPCKGHGLLYSFTPVLNRFYNITGTVFYSYSEFRILPRMASDIEQVSSVSSHLSAKGINLYPNPTRGNLSISFSAEISENTIVKVINALGAEVYTQPIPQNSGQVVNLMLPELNAGMYFVQVRTAETTITKQLVVVR
jgi:hypothetical protein